jgi:hypothetical protein
VSALLLLLLAGSTHAKRQSTLAPCWSTKRRGLLLLLLLQGAKWNRCC